MITEVIMEELTIHIILYLRDYYKCKVGIDFPREFMPKFKDYTWNFFEMIGSHLSIVLKSLGNLLQKEMEQVHTNTIMDAIQLIEFSISELPICELEDVNELLKPILSRILAGVSKLSVDLKQPINTIPALDLALTILSEFKEDSLKPENDFTELTHNVELFNDFF